MRKKREWIKTIGEGISRNLIRLADLMTNSLKDGEVLSNRCASGDNCVIREFHIESNSSVIMNCRLANFSENLIAPLVYARDIDFIRTFKGSAKSLGIMAEYEKMADEAMFSFRKDPQSARNLSGMISGFIDRLSQKKRDILLDEMAIFISRIKPFASFMLSVKMPDESRAGIALQTAAYVNGERVSEPKMAAFAKSVPDADKIRETIYAMF